MTTAPTDVAAMAYPESLRLGQEKREIERACKPGRVRAAAPQTTAIDLHPWCLTCLNLKISINPGGDCGGINTISFRGNPRVKPDCHSDFVSIYDASLDPAWRPFTESLHDAIAELCAGMTPPAGMDCVLPWRVPEAQATVAPPPAVRVY